jgi:uncharacterized protein (PEP-CTERM system associated)
MGTATGMAAKARTRVEKTNLPSPCCDSPGKASLGRDKTWLSAVALFGLGVASQSYSADWDIQPRLKLRETYTDNLRLAPKGREESDFVTEVEPGISINHLGPRLQLNVDYSLQYRLYANHGSANGHNHALNSNALLDVWDRHLFLQASARIAQQNLSPLGAQSLSNINVTGNRTDVRQATVSPYWVSRLGSWGNVEARYTWSRVDTSGEARDIGSDTRAVNLTLKNGPAFTTFGWSGTYSRQDIQSTGGGQFPERTLETTSVTGSYRLFPTLSMLATVGYEDNSYGSTQGSTAGRFWNVGADWVPSTRTRVRGTFGERYFGNTYSLDAEHRTRLTTTMLSYSEQIVATPSRFDLPAAFDTAATLDRLLLGRVPDPVERLAVVEALMVGLGLPPTLISSVDFLSNRVSLSKRLMGSFGLRGTRGNVLANVFHEKRTNENSGSTTTFLGTDPFAISNNVVQTGFSTILSWRFTQRTAGSISQVHTRSRYTDADREDTINTFRIGVTHQLQPKLHGGIDFRITDRDSTQSSQNYRENAVIGTLTFLF